MLVVKNATNVKNTKNLLYFAFNNIRKNKILLEITDFVKRKTVLTGIFGRPSL